jgi:hypothetical protein
MAALTTQNIGYAGTAPTFGAAASQDTAEVGVKNFIVYKNTNATARTISIAVPSTITPYTQVDNDVEYTLAGTSGELWIPLHTDYDTGSGRATIDVTPAVTNVTVAVVKAGWTQ